MYPDFGYGGDFPLVMGSVRGHRVWHWDRTKKKLFSPQQHFMWKNGENVCLCSMAVPTETAFDLAAARKFLPSFGNPHVYEVTQDGNEICLGWGASSIYTPRGHTLQYLESRLPPRTGKIQWSYETIDQMDGSGREILTMCNVWGAFMVPYEDFLAERAAIVEQGLPAHIKDCYCGFYAYFDGFRNGFSSGGQLIGVIEGYGNTVIGTKGFRAEKGKILALAPRYNRGMGFGRWAFGSVQAHLDINYPDVKLFYSVNNMFKKFPLSNVNQFR